MTINSSPPIVAYMRHWMGEAVVQIMACPLFWIGPFQTNFSEIFIKVQFFLFMKMHLKISSGIWRPLRPRVDELKQCLVNMYLFHYHLRRVQCDIDVHDGLYHSINTPSSWAWRKFMLLFVMCNPLTWVKLDEVKPIVPWLDNNYFLIILL